MAKVDMLGAWGEQLSARYLKKKGYKILACNYISRFGEIDIIARKKDIVAFVEVKLRKNAGYGQGREFVGYQKQARIRATAELWLCENDQGLQPRFDVIEIYAPQGLDTRTPQIEHLIDAFQ